jgi:hypothetical protein
VGDGGVMPPRPNGDQAAAIFLCLILSKIVLRNRMGTNKKRAGDEGFLYMIMPTHLG